MLYIFIGVSPPCLVHGYKHGSSRFFFLSSGPGFGRTSHEPALLVIYRNLVSLDWATCCAQSLPELQPRIVLTP
jgi:hypothetical protein